MRQIYALACRAMNFAGTNKEQRILMLTHEILALHPMRAQLLKFRQMQTNAIRGLLLEFGHPLPESYLALPKVFPKHTGGVS